MSKWIAVCKVGKYTQGDITSAMLEEMVASYDKDYQGAPFIPEHRKFNENGELLNNMRALAWVETYSTDGTYLYALVEDKHDLEWFYDGRSYRYASIEIEVVMLNKKETLYCAAIATTNFPAANIPVIEFNKEKIGSRLITAYNKIEIKNETELVMNEGQLKQLCNVFGLPENSTPETVIAKLTEMKNKFAEKDDLKAYTDKLEQVINIMSESGPGSDSTNLPQSNMESQVSKLTETVNSLVTQLSKNAQGDLETAIDQAITDKKFVPAQKEHLLEQYAGQVDKFKAFASATPIIQLNSTVIVPETPDGKPLTYDDLLKDTALLERTKNETPQLFEKLRSEWQQNPSTNTDDK